MAADGCRESLFCWDKLNKRSSFEMILNFGMGRNSSDLGNHNAPLAGLSIALIKLFPVIFAVLAPKTEKIFS